MRRILSVVTVVVLLSICLPAGASPTLDQYQHDENGGAGVNVMWSLGQTFTAGLGGYLDHIELGASGTFPATVDIQAAAGGAPGGPVLGSVYMAGGFANGWNSIDYSSQDIVMIPGQMYAIVVWNTDPGFTDGLNVRWDGGSYTGGDLWQNGGDGWELVQVFSPTADCQFRTYVETAAAVPAPGAFLLVGLGSGVVGWLRRRRAL